MISLSSSSGERFNRVDRAAFYQTAAIPTRRWRDEVTFTIPELIGTENRASRPFQFARPPRAFNQKARAPIVGLCCPSLNCNQILPGLICDRVSRDSADRSGRIVLSIKPPVVAGKADISFEAVTKHVATDCR